MTDSVPPPPDDLNALPPGTRFGELEIIRLLGTGGFGLVYLAKDHALERMVAIKEYMPGQLAQRGHNSLVSVRSGSMRETFDIGLRSFVNEARLLARFDHRSLLKVYRFWEANNTAYMAMPYLQGKTLKQWRDGVSELPDPVWLHRLLLSLLEALGELHAANVYHRDIAPDNIFLPTDGSDPILLDFGAARRAIGDRTQSFTAILKPSYAPLEQYDGASALKQGPWTDLYALGAVLYHLLTGAPPPAATRRALSDEYQPLQGRHLPGYTPSLLSAVDWALSLRPKDRPQSVGEFQEAMLGQRDAPLLPLPLVQPTTAPAAIDAGSDVTVPAIMPYETTQLMPPAPKPDASAMKAPTAVASTLAMPVGVRTSPTPSPRAASPAAAAPPSSLPRKAQALWLPLGLLAAAGLLAAFWVVLGSSGPAEELGPAIAASAASEPVASASAASEPAPALSAGESFVEPMPVNKPASVAAPPAAASRPLRTERKERPTILAQPGTAAVPAAAAVSGSTAAASPSSAATGGHRPAVSQEPAGTADPREACGSRVFIAMTICIDRKCREPAHAQHPQCVQLREIREQRERDRN
jgi:serine/threonine protein kinase